MEIGTWNPDFKPPAGSHWTTNLTTTPVADILRLRKETKERYATTGTAQFLGRGWTEKPSGVEFASQNANRLRLSAQQKSQQVGGGLINALKLGGYSSNGPCFCGSGRKFKRCCKPK